MIATEFEKYPPKNSIIINAKQIPVIIKRLLTAFYEFSIFWINEGLFAKMQSPFTLDFLIWDSTYFGINYESSSWQISVLCGFSPIATSSEFNSPLYFSTFYILKYN